MHAQFVKTLLYETTAPVASVLDDLQRLHEFDKESEKLQKQWTAYAWGFGIATLVCFIFGFCMAFIPWFALIGLVPVLIVCIYYAMHYAHRNIENRRYQVVEHVLRHLKADLDRDKPIYVRINFQDFAQTSYRKKHEPAGWFQSISQSQFDFPWLTLAGALVDGTKFRLQTALNVKRKERRKRKYTKVRDQLNDEVQLMLQVRPTRFPRLSEAPGHLMNLFPPGLNLQSAEVIEGRLVVKADSHRLSRVKGRSGGFSDDQVENKLVGKHHLLQLFLSCYGALLASRATPRSA